VSTPGQTAFGRPDLDAFFERRDGVGGLSFDHQVHGRFRQRAAYSLTASSQQSANLAVDPPYVLRFGVRAAPFAFSDFPFDSHTTLRRHHASYQGDWRLPAAGASGGHLVTVLVDRQSGRRRVHGGVGISGARSHDTCRRAGGFLRKRLGNSEFGIWNLEFSEIENLKFGIKDRPHEFRMPNAEFQIRFLRVLRGALGSSSS
jgi:hypothetical protein